MRVWVALPGAVGHVHGRVLEAGALRAGGLDDLEDSLLAIRGGGAAGADALLGGGGGLGHVATASFSRA